jgi:hypothetical protein
MDPCESARAYFQLQLVLERPLQFKSSWAFVRDKHSLPHISLLHVFSDEKGHCLDTITQVAESINNNGDAVSRRLADGWRD